MTDDAASRINPRNGLCLNALHDKAFDRLLMWVADDFTVRFAPGLHKTVKGNGMFRRKGFAETDRWPV